MPRIQAATVAEHRSLQRRALLDAARDILASGAPEAPSLSAVAQRAGLARPSVYQYFRSREDLLEAVIADMFPRWSAFVGERMDGAPGAAEQVLAYADANLELVAQGEHAVMRGLAMAAPGPPSPSRAGSCTNSCACRSSRRSPGPERPSHSTWPS
ncbi:TetR/AcrR family transcriptional regulator [Catellatospora bangladeshensis]|uniref:TetR/AcrR family transcriptional regulator n=1 Tax=Catellatospora bangladeshensis TaxID=310355 RepID=UPI0036176C3D